MITLRRTAGNREIVLFAKYSSRQLDSFVHKSYDLSQRASQDCTGPTTQSHAIRYTSEEVSKQQLNAVFCNFAAWYAGIFPDSQLSACHTLQEK